MNAGVFFVFDSQPQLSLSRWRRTVKGSMKNAALAVINSVEIEQ